MTDEIVTRVIDVIARTQYIPADTIAPESSFEDLGIDSLSGLAIVAELEKEFDVTIPNELALSLRDVGQAVAGVRSLLPVGVAGAAASAED
jgi:acyl carrier protein